MAKRGENELRRRAEERLARASADGRTPDDPVRLLHELQVHQVELQLQNEELRASRLEVELSLQRFGELFDFAPIAYFQADAAGVVLAANFAGARLLGRPRSELIGRRLAAHVADGDAGAFARFLAGALATVEPDASALAGDFLLRRGVNEIVQVRITAAPLRTSGEPSALVAVEDVTAQREAEEALRREAWLRDEFLATLSHELRNPLAPISNGVVLLQRTLGAGAREQRTLAAISRQVNHLTRIVDDLLEVTRVSRGKIRLHLERLDLALQAERTVEDHRPAYEAAGLELACLASREPLWVDADASRLAQVLGNLLGNALKFSNRGGRVEVRTERAPSGAARLSVRDDGVGIAPEVIGSIFEPFSQAPQTLDRSLGGLGLGLPMVRGLVELHGGTVRASSAGPGRGAEFVVELPAAAAARPETAAPAPVPVGGAPGG